MVFRYELSSTNESSSKLGNCEVCGKHATEVYMQSEERHYKFEHNGVKYEGWTKNGCNDYFGHEQCLRSKRR
jgi:hypothetical protein